jgi:hypothetical protein
MNVEERKEKIAALQEEFQKYDTVEYEDDRILAQSRGHKFEKLVRAVFKAWGMLRKGSYHTGDNRSEQIDGVVEFARRYCLLEAKWEKANLAASELFSFLGKVEGKFFGTIGLFVSRNPLTPNFLTALRAGRRQCIIVMHGRDVDSLFDPEFDLEQYLVAHVFHVCVSNLCHLSTDKYLKKVRNEKAKAEAAAAAPAEENPGDAKIKECLKTKSAINLAEEYAEDLTQVQRIAAARRILDDYADLLSGDGGEGSWRGENLKEFLKELVKRFPDQWTQADAKFFMDKLSPDFLNPHYGVLTEFFAPQYEFIPEADKDRFEERLKKQWDKVIGNWVSENSMSVPTEHLWSRLGAETKAHLIEHFIDFILSSRRPRFEQYQLADKVLRMEESKDAIKAAVRKEAKRAAKNWFDADDYSDEEGIKKVKKSVVNALGQMKRYLEDYDKVARGAVTKFVEEKDQEE